MSSKDAKAAVRDSWATWQQEPANRQEAAIIRDQFVDIAARRGFRAGQQYLVEKIAAKIGTGAAGGHLYRDIQAAVYQDYI